MNLPQDTTFEDLRWLLDLDLSDFKKCGEARLELIARHYYDEEPWQSIVTPNYRRQAILLCLQNELRGEALKQTRKDMKQLRMKAEADHVCVTKLKASLEDEILQGAALSDYERCWRAWKRGDETEKQFAAARIETRRAAWRLKREQEREEDKQAWQAGAVSRRKRGAEALRNRATGFAADVNWFEPMPVYNHTATNEAAPWGYCQATGQDRIKVKDFLRKKRQKPVGKAIHTGAGRPLDLYGFESNLLVLDKWLGDWLLNSPHGLAAVAPPPERVCEEIAGCLSCAIKNEFADVDPNAQQFRALLRKHWQRWSNKLTDKEVRVRLHDIGALLEPGQKIWQRYREQARQRQAEITAKVEAGYFIKNGEWVRPERHGPMPFAEVETALLRFQGMPL